MGGEAGYPSKLCPKNCNKHQATKFQIAAAKNQRSCISLCCWPRFSGKPQIIPRACRRPAGEPILKRADFEAFLKNAANNDTAFRLCIFVSTYQAGGICEDINWAIGELLGLKSGYKWAQKGGLSKHSKANRCL